MGSWMWTGRHLGAGSQGGTAPQLGLSPAGSVQLYTPTKGCLCAQARRPELIWGCWEACGACWEGFGASQMALVVKNLPAMEETQVPSLGREDPL